MLCFLGKRINKYLYYSLKVNRYTCFTIFRFKFIHGKLFFVGNFDFIKEKARKYIRFFIFLPAHSYTNLEEANKKNLPCVFITFPK